MQRVKKANWRGTLKGFGKWGSICTGSREGKRAQISQLLGEEEGWEENQRKPLRTDVEGGYDRGSGANGLIGSQRTT